jgi:uncharacterized protein YacL
MADYARGSSGSGVRVMTAAEQMLRTRGAAVRIVRLSFAVLLMTVTLVFILDTGGDGERRFTFIQGWEVPALTAALIGIGLLALDVLTPRKRLSVVGAILLGGLAGGLATIFVSTVIDLFVKTYGIAGPVALIDGVKVIFGIGLMYLGITTVLQTQDDFRLVIPYVEFAKQIRGPRPLLLDSSALIDARIVDLAASGLLQVPLIVPKFILDELQRLADSSDKANRAKGRRGLDAVARLQRTAGVDITIDDAPITGKSADQLLLAAAQEMPGVVVTTDTALAKLAGIQNVKVLNVNDIALALRPTLVPGSVLELRIVRRGEQPGQGVGYLDDGTMIVVNDAAGLIDQDLRVEVTGAVQTSAGRLIFAKNVGEGGQAGGGVAAQSAPVAEEIAQAQRALGPAQAVAPERAEPGAAASEAHEHGGDASTEGKPGPLGPGVYRKTPNRNPRRG